MKFLLAGINHETNTFHSIPTKYENFEKSGMLLRGKEIERGRRSYFQALNYVQIIKKVKPLE